jgi:RNA polymerase sigma factor (sigma-70 family)
VVQKSIANIYQKHYHQLLNQLVSRFGIAHTEDILDALQDAFAKAWLKWTDEEIPSYPHLWIRKVAYHQLINLWKKKHTPTPAGLMDTNEWSLPFEEAPPHDLFYDLLWMCQLPLKEEEQVMFALHYVFGLRYANIAYLMQIKVETVKKRINRKKNLIQSAYPYAVEYLSKEVSPTMLNTLYGVFAEGFKSSSKDRAFDRMICEEAIYCTEKLIHYHPNHPQIHALLGLFLLQWSRWESRLDGLNILLLENQKRRYNKALIKQGMHHLELAKSYFDELHPFYIEALIVSMHVLAESTKHTPWAEIAALYQILLQWYPNDVQYQFAQLIAESFILSPETLKKKMESNPHLRKNPYLWHSLKGNIYERLNERSLAVSSYQSAHASARNTSDIKALERKLTMLQRSQIEIIK